MTNKILKLIPQLLFLFSTFTFIFGTITASAYNYTNYMQDCPIDFPYCYEQHNFNNFDRCYFDCVTNGAEFQFGNAKVDVNKLDCSNYYISSYYSCKSQYTMSPLPEFSAPQQESLFNANYCDYVGAQNCKNIGVNPPKSIGNYCEYRGLNPSNCINIPVNPPKTTVDPIDGCNPNLSNSYCYSYGYRTYPETSTYSTGFDQQAFFDNSNSYYSSIDSNYYTNMSSFEPYTDSFYSNDYMSYGY